MADPQRRFDDFDKQSILLQLAILNGKIDQITQVVNTIQDELNIVSTTMNSVGTVTSNIQALAANVIATGATITPALKVGP